MPEDDPPPSLSARTLTGAGWVLVWRMSTRALGIINTIVLVRLLAPADFGLVALATAMAQVVESLSAIGVADAIVREKDADRTLYDTGFTMNFLRGLAMSVLIAACAWPLAAFFNDPRLLNIQLVLAATLLLSALENIGVVEFRRNLAFDKEFQLALVPRIAGIAVSITIAVLFANYWALVAGIVTTRVLRVAASYWLHPHRPRFTLRSWRRLIGFSFWTWLTTMVLVVRDRIDTLVIGRVLGPVKVGIYAVGLEIGSLASTELLEPLTIALFAGFSAGRRAGTDMADGYFKAISAAFLLTLPMGAGLAIMAHPLIALMFGAQWLEAVPLVRIFALTGMVKVVAYFSGVLLNAHGLIHLQFRILATSTVARVLVLFVLIGPFGLLGAAAAAAVCVLLEEAMFLFVCFRHFRLSPLKLVRGSWRCALATGGMAAVLLWVGFGAAHEVVSPMALLRDLAAGVPLGMAVYTALLLTLWLATGRPPGAEAMFLDIFGGAMRRFAPGLSIWKLW